MWTPPEFPPTLQAAQHRLAAVQVHDYARTRLMLEGAVTQISPYLTHGLLTVPEVAQALVKRFRIGIQHRLIHELGAREYAQHLHSLMGDAVLQPLRPGVLPRADYADALPADVRQAKTGVTAIDLAIHRLYEFGYLHHIARTWVASYVVHVRKIHWTVGARWMHGHLLDGDMASNALNWQRVAGHNSEGPLLFNAATVERVAPAEWHSQGSFIDKRMEMIEIMAHNPASFTVVDALKKTPWQHDEPSLLEQPPEGDNWVGPPDLALAGRSVYLLQPWALGQLPSNLPADVRVLGLVCQEWLQMLPWSRRRWQFISQRMADMGAELVFGSAAQWSDALGQALSVQVQDHPQLPQWPDLKVQRTAPPRLFKTLDEPVDTFKSWWDQVTRGVRHFRHLLG